MSEAALSRLPDQLAEARMSRTSLIRYLQELAQQTGSKLALCCHRDVGNLPRLPRRADRGGLA